MVTRQIKQLLDRLDPVGCRALERAADFAAARTHYEVTVSHVLIKLLDDEDSGLSRLLLNQGVRLDALWQAMLDDMENLRAANPGRPAFSPLLYQWLEHAWMSASLYYGQRQITPLALLDALVDMAPVLPGGPYTEIAVVSSEALRAAYSQTSEDTPTSLPEDGETPRGQAGPAPQPPADSALARFTDDLTARALEGRIDPVLGRDEEVRLMVDILCRRRKNNPILVGEPGVGKTALVEGLALRIAQDRVPDILKGVQLRTLDLGLMQAGASLKGEFEKRLREVIDEVKGSSVPIIVFIDEAHTLVGAGGEAGMADAANLLKPALARGELRTIAATTWSEYKRYFERDAALERRFQLVKVEEPSEENAIVMLNGIKTHYQHHHNILITDAAVEAAVRLSSRYINGRYLPDKAIDLLDTTAARIRMGQAARPAEFEVEESLIDHLRRRLAHLDNERRHGLDVDPALVERLQGQLAAAQGRLEAVAARWQEESHLVDAIRAHTQSLKEASCQDEPDAGQQTGDGRADEARLGAIKADARQARDRLDVVQGERPLMQAEVTAAAVADVISDWTGIPLGRMLKDDMSTLLELEDRVRERVVGQDMALAAIGRTIRSARAGMGNPDAPHGVFLFTGPSGVGKTETARAIAEELFGGERFLISINMSEYQEAHTVSQLKGAPPGYVGFGEGGILTEAVRQRPYSVVLLDEVEKAHPDVMNLFYQVFDRGFMRDGEGREIDFKNTVIVMTSNLGAEEITARFTPDGGPSSMHADEALDANVMEATTAEPSFAELREASAGALSRHFAAALLGRMQVVPFAPLAPEALQAIVALKLDAVAQRLFDVHGVRMRCRPEVIAALAEGANYNETGARRIGALVDQQLVPEIARSLLQYMADGDLPDVLSLEPGESGGIDFVFSDRPDATDDSPEAVGSPSAPTAVAAS